MTDTSHTKARILDVRADRIFAALDEDSIVLVAGFQGVSTARDVTTLGRGGSDTTAVALAAAVGAEVCEIYTDVPGVFSADPRIVPNARKLPVVSFEEMLEMAASGAGRAAAALASSTRATTACASTADRASTTRPVPLSCPKRRPWSSPSSPPSPTRSARPASRSWACPDTPGIAGRVTTALAEANVNIDMIIQGEPETEGLRADMSFTIPRDDIHAARDRAGPDRRRAGDDASPPTSRWGRSRSSGRE